MILRFNTIYFILAICLMSLHSSIFAQAFDSKLKSPVDKGLVYAGGIGGGGGHEIALAFRASLAESLQNLKNIDSQSYQALLEKGINGVVDKARVLVVDEPLRVLANGIVQESIAVNSPGLMLILVNKSRWEKERDKNLRSAIALHEYASLLHLEHTGFYPISGSYIAKVAGSLDLVTSALGDQDVPDANIAFLRALFINSNYPKSEDLKLGQDWGCFRYVANSSGFSTQNMHSYLFKPYPTALWAYTNEDSHSITGSPFDFFSTNYDPINDTVGELSSIYFNETDYRNKTGEYWNDYIRVTADGFLIVEEASGTAGYSLASIANPKEHVIAYEICKTKW